MKVETLTFTWHMVYKYRPFIFLYKSWSCNFRAWTSSLNTSSSISRLSICPTKLFNFTKFLPVKLAPILQWDGVRKICIRLAKTNLLRQPEPTEFIGKSRKPITQIVFAENRQSPGKWLSFRDPRPQGGTKHGRAGKHEHRDWGDRHNGSLISLEDQWNHNFRIARRKSRPS